jgi:ATP-dependent protease Clp ATPase subunit
MKLDQSIDSHVLGMCKSVVDIAVVNHTARIERGVQMRDDVLLNVGDDVLEVVESKV